MKKVLYALIIIASIYIINNLVRSIYSLWQKQDLIVTAQKQLSKERNDYERLKDQLSRVKQQEYVEEQARDKLFLVKSGETIVLVPDGVLSASDAASVKKSQLPIWKQWVEYFFGESHS